MSEQPTENEENQTSGVMPAEQPTGPAPTDDEDIEVNFEIRNPEFEYDIVAQTSVKNMRTLMSEKINSGWEPMGGCSFDGTTYVHAVARQKG